MADYSEYKPRTFEDDVKDLEILKETIDAYRKLAFVGEIDRAEKLHSSRADYAYDRLMETFRNLSALRALRYQ